MDARHSGEGKGVVNLKCKGMAYVLKGFCMVVVEGKVSWTLNTDGYTIITVESKS